MAGRNRSMASCQLQICMSAHCTLNTARHAHNTGTSTLKLWTAVSTNGSHLYTTSGYMIAFQCKASTPQFICQAHPSQSRAMTRLNLLRTTYSTSESQKQTVVDNCLQWICSHISVVFDISALRLSLDSRRTPPFQIALTEQVCGR